MNTISFLIISKNDNFEGKPIERLTKVLELSSLKCNPDTCEFLVADWGSDIPIHKELKAKVNCPVKIFYIPQKITKQFDTPISEVHGLNLLSRNASKNFVGRIDQDTVVGYRFIKWFKETKLENNIIYWSNRRDMPSNCISENDELVPYTDVDGPRDGYCSPFYKRSVGILMTHKNLWHNVKGYNEKNIFRNHMEHEFIDKLLQHAKIENIGLTLDCPFYHIYHTRGEGLKRKNNEIHNGENDDNWGLNNFLSEIEIVNYR